MQLERPLVEVTEGLASDAEPALRLPRRRVLIGLLGNTLLGLWWLDPAAALVVAAVAVKEGSESWDAEGCCGSC